MRMTQLAWGACPAPPCGITAPDWARECVADNNPNNIVAIAKRFIDFSSNAARTAVRRNADERVGERVLRTDCDLRDTPASDSEGRGNILRGVGGVKGRLEGWFPAGLNHISGLAARLKPCPSRIFMGDGSPLHIGNAGELSLLDSEGGIPW